MTIWLGPYVYLVIECVMLITSGVVTFDYIRGGVMFVYIRGDGHRGLPRARDFKVAR
jgi:hypothetical protein